MCNRQLVDGNRVHRKFSGSKHDLVPRSLLSIKQLIDDEHEESSVLGAYQINLDGILPTQFFEVGYTVLG
jgi:hypothetical protein